MVDSITLEFSTSMAWQSALIRRMCHSPFSHVDVVHEKGLFGASDPGGVMFRPNDYQVFGIRRRCAIKTPVADKFMEIIFAEMGKPFDGEALYAFMSDKVREWRKPDSWFCSELVAYALEEAGFFPFKLISVKNRISPADLLLLLNPWIDADKFLIPEVAVMDAIGASSILEDVTK